MPVTDPMVTVTMNIYLFELVFLSLCSLKPFVHIRLVAKRLSPCVLGDPFERVSLKAAGMFCIIVRLFTLAVIIIVVDNVIVFCVILENNKNHRIFSGEAALLLSCLPPFSMGINSYRKEFAPLGENSFL